MPNWRRLLLALSDPSIFVRYRRTQSFFFDFNTNLSSYAESVDHPNIALQLN